MERLPAWLRNLPAHHPAFLIAGRWVPLAGPLVYYVAGVRGVSTPRLMTCAAVACLPPALLFAAFGARVIAPALALGGIRADDTKFAIFAAVFQVR